MTLKELPPVEELDLMAAPEQPGNQGSWVTVRRKNSPIWPVDHHQPITSTTIVPHSATTPVRNQFWELATPFYSGSLPNLANDDMFSRMLSFHC